MNKDIISVLIDTLLKLLKDNSLIITYDEKYKLWIQKEVQDTAGKTYIIYINEPNNNTFGGEDNE